VGNATLSEVTQARFTGGEIEVDWTGIGGAQLDKYIGVQKSFEFPSSILGNFGYAIEAVRSFYARGGTTQRGDARISLGMSQEYSEWDYWDNGIEQVFASFRVGTGGSGAVQSAGAVSRAWASKTLRSVIELTPGFGLMKDAEVGVDTWATTRIAYHPTVLANSMGLWGNVDATTLVSLSVHFGIRQLAGSNRRIGFKVSELVLHGLGEPTTL